MSITVSIVSFASRPCIEACLRSVAAQGDVVREVFLLDNGPDDGTVAHVRRSFPRVDAARSGANLGYAAAAAFPESGNWGVYAASIIESFTSGLAGAAFLSYLMRISQKEHAAVQYALLTAVYALSGSVVAMPSGWLTEQMGYATYFALTAAMALPAFAFLPRASAWIGAERLYRSA